MKQIGLLFSKIKKILITYTPLNPNQLTLSLYLLKHLCQTQDIKIKERRVNKNQFTHLSSAT